MRETERDVLKTQRQISKDYNDALQAAIRKNREFLKRAKDVESGKIKPPSTLKTEKQIEAWKRGYMRRAAEKSQVVERIAWEMQNAGIKTRKRIQETMTRVYQRSRENVRKLLNKTIPAEMPEMTQRQIEILLYRNGGAGPFSKIAFANMGSDVKVTKRLRNEFAQAILRGEDDAKIIERIRKVTGMEENDARRVLRTERTHIENLAAQDTAMEHYRLTGRKAKKRWVCIFRNSRDTHKAMHGQTVDVDADFILPSGAPISYPGDSRAGAAEVCNCQCYMQIIRG